MTPPAAGLSKIPPYSVHSEKVVLGSMLADPELIEQVRPILGAGDVFFRPENGRLYHAMLAVSSTSPRLTSETLIGQLADQRILNRDGDPEPLRAFAAAAEPGPRALTHAKNVAEKARMRLLIDAVSDMLHDAYSSDDGFKAILHRARKKLTEVNRKAQEIA
ncbi:MAG: DnaB-like helicase N-terminal domain-containing protein [Planctomycetota bacterium]|jgi:replicative DNA helicase